MLSVVGPSIQDEQREKQLSPLEAVGQILKRSVYNRVSPVNENINTKLVRNLIFTCIEPNSRVS